MNSTNDDATKPIPKADGNGSGAGNAEKSTSRTQRVKELTGDVTSRIAAIRDGDGDGRGTSRTSRTGGGKQASAASRPKASGISRTGTTSANDAPAGGAPRTGGPRRVRLTLARLDPWSVMKFSFLIAVAFGLATVIATAVLWGIVDGIGLWDQLDEIGKSLNNNKPLPFMEYFQFTKMISYATVVSVLNVVIITALGTLFAFLYNIVAALLGGLKFTFTDQ